MTLRFQNPFPGLGVLILAALLLGFGAPPARAQIGGVYDVLGVQVDVTAESATAAQDEALVRAQQDALVALMERIVPQQERVRLPELTASLAQDLLSDFQVVQESRSDVRYLATVNVRFVPDRVRRLLQSIPVPFAETQSKPLVVVPLLLAEGQALLWSEANPWQKAWAAQPGPGGLVPLIVPLGDLGDIVAIDADSAVSGNPTALERIAAQHGASGALLARAEVDSASEPSRVSVDASTTREGFAPISFTVARETGEPAASLYSRAASRLAYLLQEDWKARNTIAFDRRNQLEASVQVFDLQQWGQVSQRLERVNLIESRQLLRMTRAWADLRISYYGDPQRLQVAFAQSDLLLRGDPLSGWVIGRSEDAGRMMQRPRQMGGPQPGAAPAATPQGAAPAVQ